MPVIVPGTNSTPINTSAVTSKTLQNAATGDGNGTDYDITGMATVQLLVAPTAYTGTVTFWSSIDGTTFIKIKGNQQDTTTIADNVANPGSTASLWTFQTAGLTKIRAVMSSSGGTSCTVTGAASPLPNSVPLGVTLSSAVLAAGTAVIGSAMIQSVSGTALGADVSNTELKVSNYVKSSAAGDTALTLGQTTMAASLPVTMASDQGAIKTIGTSVYPSGATPLTAASGNVAAATAAATLAATSGKTTYITGFAVTGTGATGALAVSVTVTGVITGTLTYTYAAAAGAAVENTPLIVNFPHPIPASATNTTIVVSCPTLGTGNTNNTTVAYGFQL